MLSTARAKLLAAGGLVAVVAIGVAVYFAFIKAPGDVSNGDKVEFQTQSTPAPPAPKKKRKHDTFKWRVYGWNNQHTRYFPSRVGPKMHQVWKFDGRDTVEVSPILIDGTLYVMNKRATLRAVSAKTGKTKWKKHLGTLSAATPTYAHRRLFITTLSQKAFSVDPYNRGKIFWRRKLPSRSESTPIVVGSRVFFGTEDGTVYAVGWQKGKLRWRFHADGAVKGSLASWHGKVYFGTYGGSVYCLRQRDGHVIWHTSESGLALGRSGTFYASPTIAYGRVYIGNTDGRMYSFSAHDGKLAWSRSTGNYVYAGAAVADTPSTPPTVYFGSYDHTFYALSAKTGATRWTYPAGERISGAPTVIGRTVYFSTLLGNKTFGLDIRNGHKVFQRDRGDYNPVIASPDALYLTAVNFIFKYVPGAKAPEHHAKSGEHQGAKKKAEKKKG